MSLKETVYNELENASDYISGQELADRCKVTRASVWKAVKALQEQGVNIQAVSNKGYKIISDDTFSAQSIQKYLNPLWGTKVLFYDQIDSTNLEAKRLLLEKSSRELDRTLLAAASQTAGKGRLGRSFYSPKQTGIYFSLIYAPKSDFNPAIFTAMAAVAVSRAIFQIHKVQTEIKWVNDIYLGQQKVCGILAEGTANFETGKIDAAVIGIGINISVNSELPQELKAKAGGIIANSTSCKRSQLLASVINNYLEILEGTEEIKKAAIKEYQARSNLTGKEITVTPVINSEQGKYTCRVKGISDDAKLIVELADGTERRLDSGEVSLHV